MLLVLSDFRSTSIAIAYGSKLPSPYHLNSYTLFTQGYNINRKKPRFKLI